MSVTYASHRMPVSVEWAHCDPAGIVWNPHFFEFFDTGTWLLFETVLGIPRQNLNAHLGILGLALVESGANFKVPLKYGDQAELESTVTEFRRATFDVRHRIYKEGELALEGQERRVFAARHPDDPLRMRALTIPPEIIERFTLK